MLVLSCHDFGSHHCTAFGSLVILLCSKYDRNNNNSINMCLYTVEPVCCEHVKLNQSYVIYECPADYQGVLNFQVSLYDKAHHLGPWLSVDYANVLIIK